MSRINQAWARNTVRFGIVLIVYFAWMAPPFGGSFWPAFWSFLGACSSTLLAFGAALELQR